MATRKTLIRSKVGVRLERIENLSAQGRVIQHHFRLCTLRPNQPRVIADEGDAELAFDLEVLASLADPVVAKIADLKVQKTPVRVRRG